MKKSCYLILLNFLFLCVACSPPQPFNSPKLDLPKKFKYYNNFTSQWNCSYWWKDFNDPELDFLISQALKKNYDLRLISEKIIEVQQIFRQARARRFPWLSLSGEASTIHFNTSSGSSSAFTTGVLPGAIPTMPSTSSKDHIEEYNLSLMASYEIDFWNKLSSAEKAAKWSLIATKWNREIVVNTLTAEVATQYFKYIYLTKKLKLLKERLKLLKKELNFLKSRYTKGEISAILLKRKKIEYLKILSTIPVLEKEQEATLQILSVLIGSFKEVKIKNKNKDLPETLVDLPDYMPSDLLKRRPDVKKTEALLRSAYAGYASAWAERFPSFSLTAGGGFISSEFKNFLSGDNLFWRLAAGITAPIFNAGFFKAKTKAAYSKYKQAEIEYAKTVLNAFWEVERCLLNEEKLKNELKVKKKLFYETEDLAKCVKLRYEKGVATIIDVIEAEISVIDAKISLLDVKFALLTNRIALYRALGGGTKLCKEK